MEEPATKGIKRPLLVLAALLCLLAGGAGVAFAAINVSARGATDTNGFQPINTTSAPAIVLAGATQSALLINLQGAPLALATDSHGNLYVAESGNHRVAVHLANGSYVTWVGGSYKNLQGCVSGHDGLTRGCINTHALVRRYYNYPGDVKPTSVAADSSGAVYVANNNQGSNGASPCLGESIEKACACGATHQVLLPRSDALPRLASMFLSSRLLRAPPPAPPQCSTALTRPRPCCCPTSRCRSSSPPPSPSRGRAPW